MGDDAIARALPLLEPDARQEPDTSRGYLDLLGSRKSAQGRGHRRGEQVGPGQGGREVELRTHYAIQPDRPAVAGCALFT